MKGTILLLSLLLLVVAMAAAQAAPRSNFAPPSGAQSAAAGHATSTSGNDLRGCLSGTKGDYTLTDHQGKQHRVVGDNHVLWDDVGHEVDMTGTMGTGKNSNAFQETEITDIAMRCWNFSLN